MGVFDPEYYAKKKAAEQAQPQTTEKAKQPVVEIPIVEDLPDPEQTDYKPLPKKQSFADRLPNLHKARKKKLRNRLLALISFFLIVILVTCYFLSPLSKLARVKVSGMTTIKESAIISTAQLKVNQELWPQVFAKSTTAQKIADSNPRIQDVTISFELPNALNINVKEYQTSAYALKDKVYYPVLENGVSLTEAQNKPEADYPILEGFTDKKDVLALLKQYDQLTAEIKQAISEIKATPQDNNRHQITLNMNDGNTVIAQISTLATNLAKYPQVVSQMSAKGVIDMEAGIFSYPYPSTSTSTSETEASTTESVEP